MSKSRDPSCNTRSVTQKFQLATAPIHCTAFPPALNPIWASQGSGRVSPDDLGMRDYSPGRNDDEMDGRNSMQSPGSGRVSPDDLGMRDYSLGGDNDEMDGYDGTQSPGLGRASPNDLGRRDDGTDTHDGTQSPVGELSVPHVAI